MLALLLFGRLALAVTPDDAVRSAVASRLGLPTGEVEISGIGALPGAPADADWVVTLPGVGPVTGNPRVELRAGTLRWAVRPHVVAWRELPVAAAAVKYGERVTVRTARVSSDNLGSDPVDPHLAWVARVSLAEGAPLTTTNVRLAPDASRGASVRIVVAYGAASVTAPGELLDDAQIGQSVAVLNLATRAVQRGTYQGGALVTLEQP